MEARASPPVRFVRETPDVNSKALSSRTGEDARASIENVSCLAADKPYSPVFRLLALARFVFPEFAAYRATPR